MNLTKDKTKLLERRQQNSQQMKKKRIKQNRERYEIRQTSTGIGDGSIRYQYLLN